MSGIVSLIYLVVLGLVCFYGIRVMADIFFNLLGGNRRDRDR